ncbi:hypothetical protein D3C72_2449460 [compost metagenome]
MLFCQRAGKVARCAIGTAEFADIGGEHGEGACGKAERRQADAIAGAGENEEVGDPIGKFIPERTVRFTLAALDGNHTVK